MNNFPFFKVAAIQSSPVFLDRTGSVDKAVSLIHEAASHDASLVAFPEVFIPGYPYWNWIMTPIQGSPWFEKLYKQSVDVPSNEIDILCKAARDRSIYVVIGINERDNNSSGSIYNTLLTIDNQGKLIGKHRKLVPTWAEKLTWANGDGSGLNVYKTETIGNLGSLACGENTNTLARFALLAQGETLHVASYISLPVAPDDYDMAEAIKIRAQAHSFEGKLFTVVSCSTISEEIIAQMSKQVPEATHMLQRKNSSYTGVIGPDGRQIGDALIDKEGIIYADIDLSLCIQPKQMHDIVGHYNRFDVFNFSVNKKPLTQMSADSEPKELKKYQKSLKREKSTDLDD